MADPTIEKVYADLLASHAKTGALLEDLGALLAKHPTTKQDAKRLLDYFVLYWQRKYSPEKMVVNGPQMMGALIKILATLDATEISLRVQRYFRISDRRVIEARHAFPLFIARINELIATGPGNSPAINGCRHEPPCETDAGHTALRAREARAS